MRYHAKAFKGMVPGEDALVTKAGVFLLRTNPSHNGALCYSCALIVKNKCSAVGGITACGGPERIHFITAENSASEEAEKARDLFALKGELR